MLLAVWDLLPKIAVGRFVFWDVSTYGKLPTTFMLDMPPKWGVPFVVSLWLWYPPIFGQPTNGGFSNFWGPQELMVSIIITFEWFGDSILRNQKTNCRPPDFWASCWTAGPWLVRHLRRKMRWMNAANKASRKGSTKCHNKALKDDSTWRLDSNWFNSYGGFSSHSGAPKSSFNHL